MSYQYKTKEGKWVAFQPGGYDMFDSFEIDRRPSKTILASKSVHGRYSMGVVGYRIAWCIGSVPGNQLRYVEPKK